MIWSTTPVVAAAARLDAVGLLRSSRMKLSAVHFGRIRHPFLRLSLTGPQLKNNFRGSIQTPTTRLPRLLTFVSSGQRVRLLGWWLAITRGRTCTSWIASTDFIEAANLEFQQLRIYLVTTTDC